MMQSDGNRFCGDVFLHSFNMLYSDDDSVYDQKYEKRIFWKLCHADFYFRSDWRIWIYKERNKNTELIK